MVSITLAVPEELKKEMDKFKHINWSSVAREAIKEKIEFLEEMNKLLSKSKLTKEDAIRLGRKVNKAVAERYRKAGFL